MSGNSLSLTNTRDGTFNNLYIINDNGQVENIKDLIESGSLDQATIDLINSKAPKESPTFTGTVNGITKTMVGLGNVDNTSDLNKPISTATQTALTGKANLTAPTFYWRHTCKQNR